MPTETKIRSAHKPHARVQLETSGQSMTKQSFQAECDINTIMQKYTKTGLIEHVREHGGQYGDFVTAPEYHEAMTAVVEANAAFQSVPAEMRNRFQNDPAQFLDFVQNPDNIDELVEMGLAEPPAITERREEVEPPTPPETPPEPSEDA